jgi:TRAP-type uncharacterized transport system fused permease subunit
VALAAFAAAPIAGADPMRTGLDAAKIGFAGFLIPFVFAFHPALLYKLQVLFPLFGAELSGSSAMMNPDAISWWAFLWIIVAFSLALWLLSSALAGHEAARLSRAERVLRGTIGFALLVPSYPIALPAAAAGCLRVAVHRYRARSEAAALRP